MITPEEFAQYLKNSSLNAVEQESILKILPKLNEEQTQKLAQALQDDSSNMQKIILEMQSEQDQIILKSEL